MNNNFFNMFVRLMIALLTIVLFAILINFTANTFFPVHNAGQYICNLEGCRLIK